MRNIFLLLIIIILASCQKEIDMDYHEVEPLLAIEGRVTNEGVYVLITRTRSMDDPDKGRGIDGATVTVSSDDAEERLVYDATDGRYHSPSGMKGVAGRAYRLKVTLDGRDYEAASVMPQQAAIVSTQFVWQPVLDNGVLMYEMWATDAEPDVRNYFLYRMERRATDPKVRQKQGSDAYRRSTFDDRGSMDGRIYRDIMCLNEEMMDGRDIEDDQLKQVVFDGDTIMLELMAIDRPTFEYYQSLSIGQRMGSNPKTNISGGCLGYFTAGNISRADTVVYYQDSIIRR
jgi:hypothetical protein